MVYKVFKIIQSFRNEYLAAIRRLKQSSHFPPADRNLDVISTLLKVLLECVRPQF